MDKSLRKISLIVGIIATIVGIFVGINELVNSEGDTHIENSNGTVIIGDNNSYETNSYNTIVNKITSFFIDSSENKHENEYKIKPSVGSKISGSDHDERRSDISVPREDKVIYDNDFSLVGTVVEKTNAFGGPYYEMEGGISRIDIPDDGGKYYLVNVTTYDNESEVEVNAHSAFNYKYKKDKFSDFTIASDEMGVGYIGTSDKMRDINRTIHVCPISESSCSNYIVHFKQPGLEPTLIDRNLSLEMIIPDRTFTLSDGKRDGDTVTSHGHITIAEISKEEAGYSNTIG